MRYEVDWNPTYNKEFPYIVKSKKKVWLAEWSIRGSFESLESAKAFCDQIIKNPLYVVESTK